MNALKLRFWPTQPCVAWAVFLTLLSLVSATSRVAAQSPGQAAWSNPLDVTGSLKSTRAETSSSPIRVVVRSYETAAIGAEVNARITHLPQREGDRFKKGDVIVEFDCRKINAEFDAASSVFNALNAMYENQRKLLQYRAAGTLSVDQARHELEKARAEVRGQDARRSGCQILAPFDGRVTEKAAQVHEIAQPNQPVLRIINESKLELVLMVPSHLLASVAAGTTFRVKLDETGESHEAHIVQSTGLIDPVSQSARMIAELTKQAASVVPGMSGTAIFSVGKETR
jgi:membrane fusion protein, multidrug efflux system